PALYQPPTRGDRLDHLAACPSIVGSCSLPEGVVQHVTTHLGKASPEPRDPGLPSGMEARHSGDTGPGVIRRRTTGRTTSEATSPQTEPMVSRRPRPKIPC